jgi:hypothetical protein
MRTRLLAAMTVAVLVAPFHSVAATASPAVKKCDAGVGLEDHCDKPMRPEHKCDDAIAVEHKCEKGGKG